MISLCDDNSVFTKPTNAQANPQKTILYPPPSAAVIEKIAFSMRLNRMIVLLSNSTICIYRMFKETALLEKIYQDNEVLDSEGKRGFN